MWLLTCYWAVWAAYLLVNPDVECAPESGKSIFNLKKIIFLFQISAGNQILGFMHSIKKLHPHRINLNFDYHVIIPQVTTEKYWYRRSVHGDIWGPSPSDVPSC